MGLVFGCLKRKNRCQSIYNFNENKGGGREGKKNKPQTDLKHRAKQGIKKHQETTIATLFSPIKKPIN